MKEETTFNDAPSELTVTDMVIGGMTVSLRDGGD